MKTNVGYYHEAAFEKHEDIDHGNSSASDGSDQDNEGYGNSDIELSDEEEDRDDMA